MKLNKNEQNYLLTILFKSYILQSVICSGIILVCTVSLDMGLTWVLDRYVEHYYLIYRGLYVYMVGLILWVVCILYLTYKLLKKVVNYVYELQAATGKLFDKSVDYIELSPELSEIAININRLKQEAENNARLAQENEQRKNDLIMPHIRFHDLRHTAATNMHQLTGDFYTVGEVLGHTLAGIGASLGLSMNFEAVTARYVDVRLERKKEVLDAYHSAVEKAAPEKPKEAEPKKGKRAAKKKHSEIDL